MKSIGWQIIKHKNEKGSMPSLISVCILKNNKFFQMKNINKLVVMLLMICIIAAFTTSCKKDYLTDGGVHAEKSTLSTYDYLKVNKYHYFDTTLLIIDHFNLKDSVNQAGTFFAFTDFSVQSLLINFGYANLDSLYAHSTSKLITQYLFSDSSITLRNATLAPVEYPDWAGDTAKCAVKKVAGNYNINLVNTSPSFSYFTLQYIKINGVLDGSPNAPSDDPIDVTFSCQTSDIKTATGTLQVLSNTAIINKL